MKDRNKEGRRGWRVHFAPKCRLTSIGLHGALSQRAELFISTAVRTSDPIQCLRKYIREAAAAKYHR
jgi:hypothetical protein